TCNDPMTYQINCGGTRFFRNQPAKCGDFTERACRCGTTQNSHKKLIDTFGIGTPNYGNPNAMIMAGNDPLSGLVMALAGSKRGVAKVELLVNGFPWASAKGADFAVNGQPNPGPYSLVWPATLPDGISDFAVRAHDDLGAFTDSAAITKTKGAPCTSADTCAEGQRCDAGRCLWDPPTLEVGAACDYAQQCKSLSCVGTDPKICSQECIPEDENTCPAGLACSALEPGTGVCYPETSGGCCSATSGRPPWAGIASGAFVFVLVMRRRRRR
nr:hypothetical protein [Deltaproteobacteria bacterium]